MCVCCLTERAEFRGRLAHNNVMLYQYNAPVILIAIKRLTNVRLIHLRLKCMTVANIAKKVEELRF